MPYAVGVILKAKCDATGYKSIRKALLDQIKVSSSLVSHNDPPDSSASTQGNMISLYLEFRDEIYSKRGVCVQDLDYGLQTMMDFFSINLFTPASAITIF